MLLANALNRTVLNFDMENIGARNKNMISVLGIIKYESKRTPVVEEETITSSITKRESIEKFSPCKTGITVRAFLKN